LLTKKNAESELKGGAAITVSGAASSFTVL
jgi:hypothetical protein